MKNLICLIFCIFLFAACGETPEIAEPDEPTAPPVITTTPPTTTTPLKTTPEATTIPAPEIDFSPLELLGGYIIDDDGLVLMNYPKGEQEYDPETFKKYIHGTWSGYASGWWGDVTFTIDDSGLFEHFPEGRNIIYSPGWIWWENENVITFGFSNVTISDGFYWLDINEPDVMYYLPFPHNYNDEKIEIGYVNERVFIDVFKKIN